MDRLAVHRKVVKSFLQEYADARRHRSDTVIETVFDNENDRYLVLDIGWEGSKRIHHCIFHFDIKDGKIWLQENNTDIEVDQELETMGIAKKEMVIGFHHPSMREYSDYAIA
jgi:XisI protein